MFGLDKETLSIILVVAIAVVTTIIVVCTLHHLMTKPYVDKMILSKSDRLDRFRF